MRGLLRLDRLQQPAVAPDGAAVAWVGVGPAGRGNALRAELWVGALDGSPPRRVVRAPHVREPRFSPDGSALGFCVEARGRTAVSLARAPFEEHRAVAELDGRVEQLHWVDGRTLVALVWTPLADGPSRSVVLVDAERGGVRPLATAGLTVWEIEPLQGGDAFAALVSSDPTDSGWYEAWLAALAPDGRVDELYRPEWQVSSLAADAGGSRVAFVEGWCSDRGHVAGDVRVVHVADRHVLRLPALDVDVTTVDWRDGSSLWIEGWWRHCSRYGWTDLEGRAQLEQDEATLGGSVCTVLRAGAGRRIAVREAPKEPPEVSVSTSGTWRPLTRRNRNLARAVREAAIDTRDVAWTGRDGTEITGLVMARTPTPRRSRLVVFVHGGPTTGWRKSFHVPGTILASAGYTVLLPNPRGSSGFGQAFARANIGSPGVVDLDDIVCGVDACVAQGFGAPSRVGIMGMSYGGFLSGAAATRTDRFACAVVVSSHGNFLTAWNAGTNAAFFERLLGCRPYGVDAARRYVEHSPVVHAGPRTAPTLVMHGLDDRTTPAARGIELFRGLERAGAPTELALFRGEDHGIVGYRNRCELWERALGFFATHLGTGPS